MGRLITVLRCALCKKPFSYEPKPTDICAPGTPNQICTPCADFLIAEAAEEEARYNAMVTYENNAAG